MVLRTFILFGLLLLSNLLFAFDEEKLAKSLDLDPVLESHPYNFFGVTSMFANDQLSRQMLVIKDAEAELKEMRIIEAKGFFIVEIPRNEKSYASLAFVGIKQDEVKPLLITNSAVTLFLRQFFLFPTVLANDNCDIKTPSSFESLEALNRYYQTAYVQDSLRCLSQKLTPIKENMELLKNDPKAFWKRKIKELSSLVKFISSSTKSEKLCDFFKTLSASEMSALYSGGHGTEKVKQKYEAFLK